MALLVSFVTDCIGSTVWQQIQVALARDRDTRDDKVLQRPWDTDVL